MPCRDLRNRAQQLEQQVGAVDRVHQRQLAPRSAGFLDRLARQRRRQQHVVHPHGAAAASLSSSPAVNNVSARALAMSSRPSVSVKRIGSVTALMMLRQRPLAPLPAIAFGERVLAENLIQLLRKNAREPPQLGRGLRAAAVEEQSERLVAEAGRPERQDVERRVLERRRWPPPPIGRGMRRGVVGLTPRVQRVDERIAPVLERDDERRRGRRGEAVRGDREQRGFRRRLDQAQRLPDAEGLAQPLQPVLGGVGDLGAAQVSLEEPQPRRHQGRARVVDRERLAGAAVRLTRASGSCGRAGDREQPGWQVRHPGAVPGGRRFRQ